MANEFKIHNGAIVNGPVTATTYYGDGSNLTGISGGGGASPTASILYSSVTQGYKVASAIQQLYKLTRPVTSYTSTTYGQSGETVIAHTFYCTPGSVIDEIAFRIQTAGSSGLGLAQARVLIYRSKLNGDGNIVGGDLELDTAVNINTLSTGIKVVTGLNHTLSTETYGDQWYMALRNYQTGSLSLKAFTNTTVLSHYAEIFTSGSTMARDNAWRWNVPYTDATPTAMPMTASLSPSATTVTAQDTGILYMGYKS
jgi:hypothetical protein